jgi:protoheme IX farnesyltransferase
MATTSAKLTPQTPQTPQSTWQTLTILFKWRVVSLLLGGSVGGAFLAAGGWPGWKPLLLVLVTGFLAASGSGAINQFLEKDIDTKMNRTKLRPLAKDQLSWAKWVPWLGAAMIILPSVAVATFNLPLAFFLLLGAFIYVVIYTIWLKPRTVLNIVIGGAAGSAAVLSGSAAVGHWAEPGAVVLALLVFLWTPAHFWSLAMLYRADYQRGEFPMLPAQISLSDSAWWVGLHTVATGFGAILLGVHPALGALYTVPVVVLTADLAWQNIRLIRHPNQAAAARRFFVRSNLYLTAVVVLVCVATLF